MISIKKIIFILSIFIVLSVLKAQAPAMEWFRAQGTDTEEQPHEGMQTSDGEYIAIGHGIERSDAQDMLIIKISEYGMLRWKQGFGTSGKKGAGYCIAESKDGYIAGGGIFDPDSQRTQRFLAKLDFSGNLIWKRFYGSDGVGGIRGIEITDAGDIVATGYKNAPNIGEFQGYVFIVDDGSGFIMKLDPDGNVIWEKQIDAPQGTKVKSITDGYAICSTVRSYNQQSGDNEDFCLFKIDVDGNTIWRKLFGGSKGDHCYDFDLTSDGGYILTGHTLSYGVATWDYLLMKIDSAGEEEWHKTFGQPRGYDPRYIHDEAYGVRQTPDDGYIICGGSGDEYSYSASGQPAGPSDEWKVYLVITDDSVAVLWEGIYPPTSVGNNAGEYIGLTNDGGYIVFVDTDSKTPPEPNNFGFIKLEPDPVSAVGTMNISAAPSEYALYQNYPNPFNPSTIIRFYLPQSGKVNIEVFNALGIKTAVLVKSELSAGFNDVIFDGSHLSGGVYFYRIHTGAIIKVKKCVLLK